MTSPSCHGQQKAGLPPMHKNPKVVMELRNQLAPMKRLWLGIEEELADIGITSITDLATMNPRNLAFSYCCLKNRPFDPIINDVFAAIVKFAQEGKPVPWWHFTRRRAENQLSAGI